MSNQEKKKVYNEKKNNKFGFTEWAKQSALKFNQERINGKSKIKYLVIDINHIEECKLIFIGTNNFV